MKIQKTSPEISQFENVIYPSYWEQIKFEQFLATRRQYVDKNYSSFTRTYLEGLLYIEIAYFKVIVPENLSEYQYRSLTHLAQTGSAKDIPQSRFSKFLDKLSGRKHFFQIHDEWIKTLTQVLERYQQFQLTIQDKEDQYGT